jgi:hypothetical protein
VGNLSGDTEREQLREAFAAFGRVTNATAHPRARASVRAPRCRPQP